MKQIWQQSKRRPQIPSVVNFAWSVLFAMGMLTVFVMFYRLCVWPLLLCSILGYNFDAISCESCKAFFRRNALQPLVIFAATAMQFISDSLFQDKFKCRGDGHCNVSGDQRRRCKKCRLEKCFQTGQFIRTELWRIPIDWSSRDAQRMDSHGERVSWNDGYRRSKARTFLFVGKKPKGWKSPRIVIFAGCKMLGWSVHRDS